MVNGEAIDIGTLCMLASTTVRISQRLGLNRVAKDATPSLATYLRSPRRLRSKRRRNQL